MRFYFARFRNKIGLGLLIFVLLLTIFIIYRPTSSICISDAFIESNSLTISPSDSGVIVKRYVEEGDYVKQGQLLLELDDRKFQADTKYAEAQLNLAKEELALQKIHLDKEMQIYLSTRKKFERNEMTQEELDVQIKNLEESQGLCNVKKSKIEVLETRLNIYRLKQESTKIFAPCDGVITKECQVVGDFVRKGQEIFALYDLSHVWVQAHVNEAKLRMIKLEDMVKITLGSYPNMEFFGEVFSISPAISFEEHAKSRYVPIRVSINQKEGSKVPLWPGMVASLTIPKK